MPKDTRIRRFFVRRSVGGFDFGGLSSLVTFGDSVDTDPNVILAKEPAIYQGFCQWIL